jgi:HAD superfamily hydrolase (TIGR01450 family)
VREELRALPRQLADTVAQRLVAVGRMIDEEPAVALGHAVAARRLASRISAVREAVGLAAYHAGEWQTAIAELRTFHRMSGRQTHLAVLADCERALGRPERAIDLYRTSRTDRSARLDIELLIVAAGARADLGQRDAAIAMLQVPELTADQPSLPVARLRYAYADALLAAGRQAEAREWFARAATADEASQTDAPERLLELDGVVLEEAPPEPELDDSEPERDLPEPEVAESTPAPARPAAPAAEPAADAPVPDALVPDALVPDAPVLGPAADQPAQAGSEQLIDRYDLVILDLDGVVYVGDGPVPAAADAVARLRQAGRPVAFVTNNASRSAGEIAERLAGMGIPATADQVLTSAAVAAEVLGDRLAPGSPVLVVGADALAGEVARVGLHPVRRADDRPVAVVQGYGPEVGWAELAEACLAIRAGAAWVVTNTDRTLPSPRGALPGNGALVAALQTTLERDPDLVVGKPEPALFATAAQRTGAVAPLVVGDRLDTDIEGAYRAGMDSLLVLTGISDEAAARSAPAPRRPRYLGADLTALFAPAAPLPQVA